MPRGEENIQQVEKRQYQNPQTVTEPLAGSGRQLLPAQQDSPKNTCGSPSRIKEVRFRSLETLSSASPGVKNPGLLPSVLLTLCFHPFLNRAEAERRET